MGVFSSLYFHSAFKIFNMIERLYYNSNRIFYVKEGKRWLNLYSWIEKPRACRACYVIPWHALQARFSFKGAVLNEQTDESLYASSASKNHREEMVYSKTYMAARARIYACERHAKQEQNPLLLPHVPIRAVSWYSKGEV